jgi:hypothetical protein
MHQRHLARSHTFQPPGVDLDSRLSLHAGTLRRGPEFAAGSGTIQSRCRRQVLAELLEPPLTPDGVSGRASSTLVMMFHDEANGVAAIDFLHP